MEGILNIDKPLGLSSHDVVGRVRRVCGTRRVGHAGTLDPLATGVLVIGLGRAARLIEYIVGQPKRYAAAVRLGQATNTYDAEGEVTAEWPLPAALTAAALSQTLDPFRGEIAQIPPMYSAIKKGGQPLYKLARRGEEIEREARPVTIYALELVGWEPPLARLEITCSAGTYIRSIAHDWGAALGCGGHLVGLRRTAVGQFKVEAAVPLDTLTAENVAGHLLPADAAVAHLPQLTIAAEASADLLNGKPILRGTADPTAELARTYTADGTFIGLVEAAGDSWRPKKMFMPHAD